MAVRNVVTDTFSRTVSNGWGNADTGQLWTSSGAGGTVSASDFGVSGGFGTESVPVTSAYRHSYLQSVSLVDVDATTAVKVNRSPVSGAPIEIANLELRMQNVNTYYLFRVQIETNQTVTAKIFAPGGTQLAAGTVPGLAYSGTSQLIRVRAQCVGTTLRMRVWDGAGSEPVRWLLSVGDSSLTAAGWVGIRTGVAGGNTNTSPVVASYDSFTAGVPYTADFPDEDLELLVYAAFGADLKADPYTWVYTDLSGDLLEDPVQLAHGRSDGSTEAQPASFSCALFNPDGRYTRGHPASPHWPYVRENTPILVLINPDTSPYPVQFDGFSTGWTPTWSVWAQKPATTLSAGGALQRVKRKTTPLRSPVTRAVLAAGPYQYWPCEDGPDSTQAASALPGQPAMIPTGSVDFSSFDPRTQGLAPGQPYGTQPLPNLSGASLGATFPAGSSSAWTVQFTNAADVFSDQKTVTVAEWTVASGNTTVWRYISDGVFSPSPSTRLEVVVNGSATTVINNPGISVWAEVRVDAVQSGSNIAVTLRFATSIGEVFTFNATISSATLGGITRFTFNPNRTVLSADGAIFGVGHARIWNGNTAPNFQTGSQSQSAWMSYNGETATTRIQRLCNEQGVQLVSVGVSDEQMGPQGISTFSALLQECEDVDGGQLYDGLGPGIGYVARTARQNLPPGMVVDYSSINVSGNGSDSQVLVPTDDDQQLHNRWTVGRVNGSSATVVDLDGPLGEDTVDEHESSDTLNLFDDSTLAAQAAWRVHLGTVDSLRYPNVTLDLAANPELIASWLGVGLILGRLTKTNLPPQHPPGDVDLVPVGRRQTIGRRTWTATANMTPFRPWQVWEIGDTQLGRLGAGKRSTLHQAYAAAATSILVDTSPGPLWVTTAARPTKFPFDVDINGWQVHVTAISGPSSPQTFTVDPLPAALPAGARVQMWKPGVLAL